MARKPMAKVPLNPERLQCALELRNTNIQKLADSKEVEWSAKTIWRGIHDCQISPKLLDQIGKALDVEPAYLSGEYDKAVEHIKDKELRSILKKQIKASRHPYLIKQQEERYDGKFLYEKYLEYILVIHDISLRQFEALEDEQKKSLQLDIEYALTGVIKKYFKCDAKGRNGLPELDYWAVMIENSDTE